MFFLCCFFFSLEIHIVYSTTVDKSLLAKTIKCENKTKKKNVFSYEDKSENKVKTRIKTKNRWQMGFFRWYMMLFAHIIALSPMFALFNFFFVFCVRHTQMMALSRLRRFLYTRTHAHNNRRHTVEINRRQTEAAGRYNRWQWSEVKWNKVNDEKPVGHTHQKYTYAHNGSSIYIICINVCTRI